MSRFSWRGPAFRLDLAHSCVTLYPQAHGHPLGAAIAVARLDAPDLDAQMRALAARVRGRVLVMLPEAEVWRGRMRLAAGSPATRRAEARAALAPVMGADAAAVALGPTGECGATPVAAVRRATLKQTRAFLDRFGIAVHGISGDGGFEGFDAPPLLDRDVDAAMPDVPPAEPPRRAAAVAPPARRVLAGVAAIAIALGLAAQLRPDASAVKPEAAPQLSAALAEGPGAAPSRTPPVRPRPEPEPQAVPLPAPAEAAQPSGVVQELRPSGTVQEWRPSGAVQELRPSGPTKVAPPVVAQAGPVAAAAAPQLARPGTGAPPALPRLMTIGSRNMPAHAAAPIAAPAPETAPAPVLAALPPRPAALPVLSERIAALGDVQRPLRRSPAAAAPVAVAAPPVYTEASGRPRARPLSQAALSEAIGRAVAVAATEAPAPQVAALNAVAPPAPRRAFLPARAEPVPQVETAPRVVAATPVAAAQRPQGASPLRIVRRIVEPARQAGLRVAAAAPARQQVGLGRGDLSLIGIFGTPEARRALVRLPDASVARVAAGESVQGYSVAAITGDGVHLRGGGRDVVLKLPE